MKIDIYHLFVSFDNVNFCAPLMLDVLKVWSDSAGWEARARTARERSVDLNTDADAVAFSVYTLTASIAYRLCEKLRRKGKIVILGGPHFRGPNFKEAFPHCDVVASSICLEQWLQLLKDIKEGNIEPASPIARHIADDEGRFRIPDNLHTAFAEHAWYQLPSIITSYGCPYNCEFCNPFMQGSYHTREVEVLYREMSSTGRKAMIIPDAVFGLNKKKTMELMEAIAPLKKTILLETTPGRIMDRELLTHMARGGIRVISIGIETLSLKMAKHGGKNMEEDIKKAIDDCHDLGIIVEGNFIFGLDSDGPDNFERVIDFYRKSSLDIVFCDILTPYPNTALYYRMLKEERIIDQDWSHYNYRNVVYRPLKMTIEQLVDGFTKVFKEITAPEISLPKAKALFRNNGLSRETFIIWALYVFNRRDALRKEKDLKRSLELMAPELRDGMYRPAGPDAGRSSADRPSVRPGRAVGRSDSHSE